VFAVAFELPAASVPWRGGSSFSGNAHRFRKDTNDSTCQWSIKITNSKRVSQLQHGRASHHFRFRCSISKYLNFPAKLCVWLSFSLILTRKIRWAGATASWPRSSTLQQLIFWGKPKVQCWVEGLDKVARFKKNALCVGPSGQRARAFSEGPHL